MNGASLAKAFASKWKERHGKSLQVPFARAGAFFKQRLGAGDSAEEILATMDFFFNSCSDSFAKRRGFDFVAFSSLYNALMLDCANERTRRQATSVTDVNFDRLAAARLFAQGEDDE